MNAADLYAQLERTMHEPARLSILCEIAGEEDGLAFTDLKERCNLTDGNLNRHLKTLRDAGIVTSSRANGKGRARTRVELTPSGRKAFLDYLAALETVLSRAAESLSGHESTPAFPMPGATVAP